MYSVHVDEEGAPLPLMYTYTHVSSRLIKYSHFTECVRRGNTVLELVVHRKHLSLCTN